jgi:hypothetical protein
VGRYQGKTFHDAVFLQQETQLAVVVNHEDALAWLGHNLAFHGPIMRKNASCCTLCEDWGL